jgi:hypothetical protein
MRNRQIAATTVLAIALLFPVISLAQSLSFKEINARVSEYKVWLDKLGSNGSHYWLRLDGTKRPHRLYVGEGFTQATTGEKEEFIEIFSRYLAGHPEKNMLIDIYDGSTGKVIGEYGFGGFRLYTVTVPTTR